MGFVAAYARKLCVERGVDSQATWAALSRSGDRPRDIPGNPRQTYKGKGRLVYDDWFGKPASHVSRVFLEGFLKVLNCGAKRPPSSPDASVRPAPSRALDAPTRIPSPC